MLQYPSILGYKKSPIGLPCVAFYKYDGSNLRWEWTPKRNWFKYGTRTQLFDAKTPFYSDAIPIFNETLANDIVELVQKHERKKVERITAFTEFFGPTSFAGNHTEGEPKQLVLFDVSVYKRGFISPTRFADLFEGHPHAAKVVYRGNMSYEFINDVRIGKYNVVEGVVCKGTDWMAKVKTLAYLERLKARYKEDWEKYAE